MIPHFTAGCDGLCVSLFLPLPSHISSPDPPLSSLSHQGEKGIQSPVAFPQLQACLSPALANYIQSAQISAHGLCLMEACASGTSTQ